MLKLLKRLFGIKPKKVLKNEHILNNFDGLEAMYLDEYGCVTYNEDYFDLKYPGYVANKDWFWKTHQEQFKRAIDATKDFILHVENKNNRGDDKSLESSQGAIFTVTELFEWYKATQLPENRPHIHINGKVDEKGEPIVFFEA